MGTGIDSELNSVKKIWRVVIPNFGPAELLRTANLYFGSLTEKNLNTHIVVVVMEAASDFPITVEEGTFGALN